MQTDPLIADALQLLGTTDPDARTNLTAALHSAQLIAPHSHLPPQELVCVDGAVATTQTDVLVWTSAVAGTSDSTDTISHQVVTSVNPTTERLRSAAMAICEMRMALRVAQATRTVWMDGSLSTPLLSVSTAISGVDEATAPTVDALLTRTDSLATIGAYLDLARDGKLRALPKQDTAHGFSEDWERLPTLAAATQQWVAERKDHTLARNVLRPGEHLVPRRAREALRVKVRSSDDLPDSARRWAGAISPLFSAWRTEVDAHVTYAMPHVGAGRPVKVEFTTVEGQSALTTARDAVEAATSHIAGVQVVEPLPQYLVDVAVKKQVATDMLDLMQYADQQLGGRFPEAVNTYRS